MPSKITLENEIKAYEKMGGMPPTFLKKYRVELKMIEKHLKDKNYSIYPRYTRNIRDADTNNPGYEPPYRSSVDSSVR